MARYSSNFVNKLQMMVGIGLGKEYGFTSNYVEWFYGYGFTVKYGFTSNYVELRRHTATIYPTQNGVRACLYEAGWPVSELAHLQVRRDLGYRLPGSRLKRADFSHINRRNGPGRLLRTRSITFGAVSQKIFPCSFNFTQKNDGTWLLIAGLARGWLTFESLI